MLLASPTQINVGLLLFRLALGAFMMVHGLQKVMNFAALSEGFPDPIGAGPQLSLILAIGAEVGCSLLLMVGLLTRLAVIPLAVTMVVALFLVHAADPWNVKELAAVFLAMYVVLLITGPGTLSIDSLIARKKEETP